MDAARKVMQARTNLVLDHPFFGALALKLTPVADPGCKTAYTNGVVLGYCPEYVEKLTMRQLEGLIAEEVMHCAQRHITRRGGRHPKAWNMACDYSLSPILKESGFDTADMLFEAAYTGKSAEEIYSQLPPPPDGRHKAKGKPGEGEPGEGEPGDGEPGDGEPGDGPGAGDYGRGAVRDAPDTHSAMDAEWQAATANALKVAKALRGTLPGSLQALLEKLAAPVVDWKALLREFMAKASNDDYSWTRPNKRYLDQGFILPSLWSQDVGTVVVVADTSGSCGSVQEQFFSELKSILDDVRPEKVWFLQCDSRVADVRELEPGDSFPLTVKGLGGTSFKPPFAWVKKQDIEPVCLIYLTDLEGDFPDEPDYPVLWASVTKHTAPFGTTLRIE